MTPEEIIERAKTFHITKCELSPREAWEATCRLREAAKLAEELLKERDEENNLQERNNARSGSMSDASGAVIGENPTSCNTSPKEQL